MDDRNLPRINLTNIREIKAAFNTIYALIYRDNYDNFAVLKLIESELIDLQVNLQTHLEKFNKPKDE